MVSENCCEIVVCCCESVDCAVTTVVGPPVPCASVLVNVGIVPGTVLVRPAAIVVIVGPLVVVVTVV